MANVAVHYGYGKHMGDIAHPDLLKALYVSAITFANTSCGLTLLQWFWLTQIFYKCCTWSYKASILMMYHRVFGDTPDVRAYGIRFRSLLIAMLTVVGASFLASLIVTIFACVPLARSWDKSVAGHCVATVPWWYSYAALNIVTDLIILAMPLPLINGLQQIGRRQKVVLMGIFTLGGL
jgi:hypothetical protein